MDSWAHHLAVAHTGNLLTTAIEKKGQVSGKQELQEHLLKPDSRSKLA